MKNESAQVGLNPRPSNIDYKAAALSTMLGLLFCPKTRNTIRKSCFILSFSTKKRKKIAEIQNLVPPSESQLALGIDKL